MIFLAFKAEATMLNTNSRHKEANHCLFLQNLNVVTLSAMREAMIAMERRGELSIAGLSAAQSGVESP